MSELEQTITRLEAAYRDLQEEHLQLRQELDALHSSHVGTDPSLDSVSYPPGAPTPAASLAASVPPLSRRHLLLGAGAAVAGAAAGVLGAGPHPAFATDGQAVIAGQDTTDTAVTSISGSVATGPALRVANYNGGSVDNYSDALQAYTYGAGLTGVYGRNDAPGGAGVLGYSGSGLGGSFSGGQAPIRLQPAGSAGAPTTNNHQQGELSVDSNGVLWLCTASGTPSTPGTFQQVVANPMSAQGDLIVGGASGAPARLAAGSNGQVLTLTTGSPSWQTPAGPRFPEGYHGTVTGSFAGTASTLPSGWTVGSSVSLDYGSVMPGYIRYRVQGSSNSNNGLYFATTSQVRGVLFKGRIESTSPCVGLTTDATGSNGIVLLAQGDGNVVLYPVSNRTAQSAVGACNSSNLPYLNQNDLRTFYGIGIFWDGSTVHAYYSFDGVDWREIYSWGSSGPYPYLYVGGWIVDYPSGGTLLMDWVDLLTAPPRQNSATS